MANTRTLMEQHIAKSFNPLKYTEWKRDEVIYEIQEAEATWIAKECVKNLQTGIDIIFVFSRSPNKYAEMSDSKLQTIKRLIDNNKDFDFFSVCNIRHTYPDDENYPMFKDRDGNRL